MKAKCHMVIPAALAGLCFLGAVSVANAQPATPAQPAAIHGAAIDAAPATPVAAVASSNVVIQMVDGVANADFETLASYPFIVPDLTASNHISVAEAEQQIPAAIKQLDGKTVRIRGFMMPIKEENGKTTEFMITRSQPTCCYSGATEINEFVTVKVAGKGFDTMMDDPVCIQGTLHVGAVLDGGFIVGLYELDANKLVASN